MYHNLLSCAEFAEHSYGYTHQHSTCETGYFVLICNLQMTEFNAVNQVATLVQAFLQLNNVM